MGTSLKQLRDKHQAFIYQKYQYSYQGDDLQIQFRFLMEPDIYFEPSLLLPNASQPAKKLNPQVLDNLIFHLGMIELFSYWKSACPPLINIKAGHLSSKQISWWEDLLLKGLGEFFYQNQIDFTPNDFITINSTGPKIASSLHNSQSEKSYLVQIGGGKDSAVSLALLDSLKLNQTGLSLNPSKSTNKLVGLINNLSLVPGRRQIHPKLLWLNQEGYLNGHTPFSAYLAFFSLLVAAIYDFRTIITSNERSSDEANLEYLNHSINHQYSKTFEFEISFRQYIKKHLSTTISYFSLLRPLWEIQVSRIFAKYPKYFSVFKSCNIGQKTNSWCCQCPKCLSSFILLFPFLGQKTIKVFGKNLYDDPSLSSLLFKLAGLKGEKPFECVGTFEEIKIGLYLSLEKYNGQSPYLLKLAREEVLIKEKNLVSRAQKLLTSWGQDDFLDDNLKSALKKLAHD